VEEILSLLTSDLATWRAVKERFEIDLYCGLFMQNSNEVIQLSPSNLLELGERGIPVCFEIYGPTQAPRAEDPCPCGSGDLYANCCAPKAV
jgi:SEC-C motif